MHQDAQAFFQSLNQDYLTVHKTKEDLFWATYMATSEDHAGFAAAEGAYKAFISDPARLQATRAHLAALQAGAPEPEREALVHGLSGWLAVFEANIVDNDEGRALMAELIAAESALFAAKKQLAPTHLNERGEREVASLSMLATNAATNPDEAARRSSFEAFQAIERWVLDHGFLDLVRLRNRFARTLGFPNYFELKLQKNERMSSAQLFAILDDFVARTEAANTRALADLKARHGETALEPMYSALI
eukprot:Opistho-2@26052